MKKLLPLLALLPLAIGTPAMASYDPTLKTYSCDIRVDRDNYRKTVPCNVAKGPSLKGDALYINAQGWQEMMFTFDGNKYQLEGGNGNRWDAMKTGMGVMIYNQDALANGYRQWILIKD